jgi:hypothetical protein
MADYRMVRVRGHCRCVQLGAATAPHERRTLAACVRLAAHPLVCPRMGKRSYGCLGGLLSCFGFSFGHRATQAMVAFGVCGYRLAAALAYHQYPA